MNFHVITNADTVIGRVVARELAQQKRNLILLGENITELEELKRLIKLQYPVHIHIFGLAQPNRARIIELCDFINDHFFVESLVDIVPDGGNAVLPELMIPKLDQQLTADLVLPLLVIHQLLPNLMLCAESTWIRVISNDHGLSFETYKFSETVGLLKCKTCVLTNAYAVGSERKCSLPDIMSMINSC